MNTGIDGLRVTGLAGLGFMYISTDVKRTVQVQEAWLGFLWNEYQFADTLQLTFMLNVLSDIFGRVT